MTFLEFLDRMGERRAVRLATCPKRPWDSRALIGCLFLAGYYAMVYQFSRKALPTENLDLIRDAMLTLGPPVGAIVAAMFRSDVRDEIAAQNTGEGFRAVQAAAKAGTSDVVTRAADDVADAAADKADEIKGEQP